MTHTVTTAAMAAPLFAPLAAAAATAVLGWRTVTAAATVLAAVVVGASGVTLAVDVHRQHFFALDHLLRADALAAVMLIVIGAVATLAALASDSYLRDEHPSDTTNAKRQYGVLINIFVAAMVLAVLADNLGVVWVAVEATTIATAFLVGHRRTRRSLEATWKYVVICSVGIAMAFLGTVLLYFASLHAGATHGALNLDILNARAPRMDPGVTRLAAVLLLVGYGTKVGLAPFHTWLADAHSQAPAPVSALMSGVLLSVAFSVLLRVRGIVDIALGPAFLRNGLLALGLLTLLVAAALLVVQRDYKRMLAYSSMEHMGLVAIAAAAGTTLAIAALLLHILGHGLGKAVLFLTAGQLEHAHRSTAIKDVHALATRSPVLATALGAGLIALLGLPPFALFASEVGIARGVSAARLSWVLVIALVLMLIAFGALVRHGISMLFGDSADAPVVLARKAAVPLGIGLTACLALGVSAGPLISLMKTAAASVGGTS
jgi:hydrogenase-4 component F